MKYSTLIVFLLILAACGPEQRQAQETETTEVVRTGAEQLIEDNFGFLNGKNVGLITNLTAVVGDRHIADIFHEAPEVNLVALYGPEHGIRGDARGRIEFEIDESTGLPVHSLYGDVRRPTAEMLEGIDLLVYDIQLIGPRFYTFKSTLGMAMEAAAEHDISFMVLDRPNPLGGVLTEGFVREPEFESFIAYYEIPVTHGMTAGELALMAKGEGMLEGVENLDLHVAEVENWTRDMLWPDWGHEEWIPPSPNIPDFETALIYPGACFFERVHASEGRGTMEPFILLGAPWADGEALAADLNARNLPGLRFEPVTYTPKSITYRGMAENPGFLGEEVYGIRHVITDPHAVRPVETGIHILHAFHTQAEARDEEFLRESISSHAGTERLYDMMTGGATAEEIIASWNDELSEYNDMRRRYFLYD